MCYSPEADLIAGAIVGAIAVDAIRHVDDRTHAPLAAIPAVLGAHQIVEAVAWWGLLGRVPSSVGDHAVSLYLVIAFGVVPFLVPFAVMRCEPEQRRRTMMTPLVALGAGVATVLVASLVVNPYGASIGGRFIAYHATIPLSGLVTASYVAAVCIPLLMSSHRGVVTLGILNIPAVGLLAWLNTAGFISLWCIWAAVTSLVVAREVRQASPHGVAATRNVVAQS